MVGTRIETAPAQSPGWRGGAGPLAILPRVLFRDERPWLAILVGWLLTIAGSTLIGWIVARIAPDNSGPDFGDVSGATKLFLIALFSPVVETLIMAGVLSLLLRFLRPWHAVVASALLWGIGPISIGAMSLWFVLLRHGNATKVSTMMYLTPPTTALMAWLLFNEPLSAMILLGTLVTMVGVLIVNQTPLPAWARRAR